MEQRNTPSGVILRLRGGIEKVLNVISGVMLAGMVIIVFSNVIARYFLNASIAWSDEVSRFMFIWLVFIGAVVAYMRNDHLGLDILIKYLPKKASQTLVLIADLLVLFALVVLLNGGIQMTADSFASGWVSSAVQLPYGYIYLVGPISAFFLILENLLKTVTDAKAVFTVRKGGK
jgi:TRAP-type C4-dicarboxylate transport system permease small subunit